MPTKVDFQYLAEERLKEAEIMFQTGLFSGAWYIGGYAIEFALKAVICNNLDVEMFDETVVNKGLSQPFRTHNLTFLVLTSGLYNKLNQAKNDRRNIFNAWNVVSNWKETRRYERAPANSAEIQEFLNSANLILLWIKTYW